jgi:protein-S-isoprenylcysteine O-methyltransferase Ste14
MQLGCARWRWSAVPSGLEHFRIVLDNTPPRMLGLRGRFLNWVSSCAVMACALSIFSSIPFYQRQLAPIYRLATFSFSGYEYLLAVAFGYALLLGVYYAAEAAPQPSKSLRFWAVLARLLRQPATTVRANLSADDRLAIHATLLKSFFGPIMVLILMRVSLGSLQDGQALLKALNSSVPPYDVFNSHGFWFAIQLIVVVDVAIFSAGYLIEMPRLKNEIKSVDQTLLGWAAALLCYYPFSEITGYVLGREVSDFPQFSDSTTHVLLNVMLLVLMAIYASASVALGFKASNLTHRGIVAGGPYAFVRHPAYVCKNLAWWIGALPAVTQAFTVSWFAGISSVASVIGWSLLYVLRALTEEDHLRRVDDDYAAYAERVRWRFIPGIA